MQDHTCLLDHPHRHTHPRPSSNPVGTTVPLGISHVLIGLHSPTPIVYRPIWHTLVPKKTSRRRDPTSLINHTIPLTKLPIDSLAVLYMVLVALFISDRYRDRGREARCDGVEGKEQSWPIPKPFSILDTPWKSTVDRNDDVHSSHTRKPLHCDLPARNLQQNMHVTTYFDNT